MSKILKSILIAAIVLVVAFIIFVLIYKLNIKPKDGMKRVATLAIDEVKPVKKAKKMYDIIAPFVRAFLGEQSVESKGIE